jgi:O-antigen ligase
VAWGSYAALAIALLLGAAFALLPLPLVAAALVVIAVPILFLVQPLLGLGLLLIAAPFGALENIILGNRLLDSGQLLFLLLVAVWLARGVTRRRIELPLTRLTVPLLLFLLVAALTLVGAPSLSYGFRELIKWLEIGVMLILVADLGRQYAGRGDSGAFLSAPSSETFLRLVLLLVLVAGVSQALIGIWQFGLRGSGPEHFEILGGGFFRAYGTFEQPNPFGGFMAWMASLGLGATVGLLMSWFERRALRLRELWWLLLFGAATVLTGLALLFSWSRGAWLGFAAAAAVLAFFWPRQRRWGVLLVVLLGGSFLVLWQSGLLPAALLERTTGFLQDLRFGDMRGVDINDANYAVIERLAHWQVAVDMARENLWLGVGFGNYEPAYDQYALLNWPFALGHAHNYYLNVLAETGVTGFLAYLLFWAAVFLQTIRLLRRLNWPARGIALGLLAAWTALMVHHLLDKLYVNNLYLHLGVMFGILHLLHDKKIEEGPE